MCDFKLKLITEFMEELLGGKGICTVAICNELKVLTEKEGVTEEQVTDLINAETWMTAEEAREIFDVQIEERPAVAACVGWMMENFKKAPEGIKTQSADDVTAKITAEEEAIIEEMELFGI